MAKAQSVKRIPQSVFPDNKWLTSWTPAPSEIYRQLSGRLQGFTVTENSGLTACCLTIEGLEDHVVVRVHGARTTSVNVGTRK